MNESEYRRLKREAEREHQANLDAIERVWKLTQQFTPNADRPLLDTSTEDVGESTGTNMTTTAAVEAVAMSFDAPFTWRHVQKKIQRDYPEVSDNRTAVSKCSKLEEEQKIQIREKGTGPNPTSYERPAGPVEVEEPSKRFLRCE